VLSQKPYEGLIAELNAGRNTPLVRWRKAKAWLEGHGYEHFVQRVYAHFHLYALSKNPRGRARKNASEIKGDPNELVWVLIFWPHSTLLHHLHVFPDSTLEGIRQLLGPIPDYTQGVNYYGPASLKNLQFVRGTTEGVGSHIKVMVPRRLCGSVLGEGAEYQQYSAFDRWVRQAENKLREHDLLFPRSRRNPSPMEG